MNNFSPDLTVQLSLANALAANDNGGGFPTAQITFSLLPGVSYLAVATGFANDDFGAASLTISGPGIITLVQSPNSGSRTSDNDSAQHRLGRHRGEGSQATQS